MDGMFPRFDSPPGIAAIDAWMDEAEQDVAEAVTPGAMQAAAETYAALRELAAAVVASIGVAAHG